MPLAHFPDRRIVGGKTEEVDGHDDPGCEIRLVLDEPHSFFEFGGVEVEGSFVHIDENGRRAEQGRRLPAREKSEVGNEHRIARPDAPRHERELQGVRAVGACHAVLDADVGSEARLELGDLRAADVAAVLEHPGDARVDTVFQRGVLRTKIPELHHQPTSNRAICLSASVRTTSGSNTFLMRKYNFGSPPNSRNDLEMRFIIDPSKS